MKNTINDIKIGSTWYVTREYTDSAPETRGCSVVVIAISLDNRTIEYDYIFGPYNKNYEEGYIKRSSCRTELFLSSLSLHPDRIYLLEERINKLKRKL
jgi:hypothetical protein